MNAFKTIYFPDYPSEGGASGLTVSFPDPSCPMFQAAARLSSFSLREILGHDRYSELKEAAEAAGTTSSNYVRNRLAVAIKSGVVKTSLRNDVAVQSTFVGGKGSPLHDWFPYLEGYSPEFVETIIETYAPDAASVLDPFCGSGTTAIVAARLGRHATFCEVNPVCRTVISSKILALTLPPARRQQIASQIESLAEGFGRRIAIAHPDRKLQDTATHTFGKRPVFDADVLGQVLSARTALDEIAFDSPEVGLLAEVAVLGALVQNSRLVRRGDLRFKNERELARHAPAFVSSVISRLCRMAADIRDLEAIDAPIKLACADVRSLKEGEHGPFDAVVTSPPYLNGTNYFRNTKLELWFGRHLQGKAGLRVFRDAAITSGINDVTNGKTNSRTVPNSNVLASVLKRLEAEAYDQRIPKMVAAYFAEMAEVVEKLAGVTTRGGTLAIDLGDSCYGDVFVPTDTILRELMNNAGCIFQEEVVLRERQSRSGRKLRQTLQIFKTR